MSEEARAERESGMTLDEAQAYVAGRLHAWRLNIPDRIPKELRAARVLLAALSSTQEEVEKAWREGFDSARKCLTEDEAFCLTVDVEEDAWRDSDTRARAALDIPGRDGGRA